MKNQIIIGGSVLVALTITGFIVKAQIKKKEEKQDNDFGDFQTKLENTSEPEKIDRAVLQQAFSTSYWKEAVKKRGENHSIISAAVATELAKQIYEAWNAGSFWDDLEEEVYRAFEDHRLKTFADVSRVAEAYKTKAVANKDLWIHLKDKLSDTEFSKVKAIVIKKIAQ